MNRLLRLLSKDQSVVGSISRGVLPYIPGLARKLSLHGRLLLGQMPRIYYSYCAVRAAELAVGLGYSEVSMLEFGVAGGNGLLALEEIKLMIERFLPIKIKLFGFDLGSGLPAPKDYRDLPYHWRAGYYRMDVERLTARLKTAELVLGPVSQTIPALLSRPPINAPIGMISFDLDYYSSTVDALKIFEIDRAAILPRVMCYMDDVVGTSECYSDFTGERLAIYEFNQNNQSQKISRCYDFELFRIERWQEKVMIYHDFIHPLYTKYIGSTADQTSLGLQG